MSQINAFIEEFRNYIRIHKAFLDEKGRIKIKYKDQVCCPITFLSYVKYGIYYTQEQYLRAAIKIGLTDISDALRIAGAADHPFNPELRYSVGTIGYIRQELKTILGL